MKIGGTCPCKQLAVGRECDLSRHPRSGKIADDGGDARVRRALCRDRTSKEKSSGKESAHRFEAIRKEIHSRPSGEASPQAGPNWEDSLRRFVVDGDFDEIAVGVAEVEGGHRAEGARASDRAFFYCDLFFRQMLEDFLDLLGGDKAEIGGTRRGVRCLGIEGVVLLVKIDLLTAEMQTPAAIFLARFEVQRAVVEVERRGDAGNGKNEVVEAVDHLRLDAAYEAPSCERAPVFCGVRSGRGWLQREARGRRRGRLHS